MSTIETGYAPHPFQREIHERMTRHRFGVLVCHRRFGKTVCAVNMLVDAALRFTGADGRFGYVAPYLKQATQISWDYVKRHTSPLGERVRINESGKFAEFANGSRLRLFGADNPDSLRGLYFDGVVVDEVADVKPAVWGEILRPALADRRGWAIFMGTPKGVNLFSELYAHAKATPGWYAAVFRADETNLPWLPPSELALARQSMSEAQFSQEFLCDFSAAAANSLISPELAAGASGREADRRLVASAPRVLGVDVARFGNDRTVLFLRQGPKAFTPVVLSGADNMEVAARVAEVIASTQPEAVFIDAGGGQGVIDRLRQLGFAVCEVNFGGRASRPVYANKRAEMWDELRAWLKGGGAVPDLPELRADLTALSYSYDSYNRLALEKKERLKERGLRSPDLADALALTFAWPNASEPRPQSGSGPTATLATEFDPYVEE